jgi:hypothetical protein
LTTTKLEIPFQKMLNAIGDSVSDLASSEDEEDGEDEDEDEEDTGHGKLSKDDEHGRVMGTISKTVQHLMQIFVQKQQRLDKLNKLGWRDMADYFRERDMMYWTTKLNVPSVGKPQADSTVATPSLTTFGELLQVVDNIPGQSQIAQVTSGQDTSQMRVGLEKPQEDNNTVPQMAAAVPDPSPIVIAKPVQPTSFYYYI